MSLHKSDSLVLSIVIVLLGALAVYYLYNLYYGSSKVQQSSTVVESNGNLAVVEQLPISSPDDQFLNSGDQGLFSSEMTSVMSYRPTDIKLKRRYESGAAMIRGDLHITPIKSEWFNTTRDEQDLTPGFFQFDNGGDIVLHKNNLIYSSGQSC